MRVRILLCLLLLTALGAGEEITLKDGSKVTGKVVGVNDKVFEVDSSYGRLQIPRQEIVTIAFPQNQEKPAAEPEQEAKPRQVDHSLEGTLYTNRTGRFTLTVPKGWVMHHSVVAGDIIGAVGDQLHYAIVLQEDFDGTLAAYKGLVEMQKATRVSGYQKVSETPTSIDGRPAVLLSFKGTTASANNLPMQFLMGIVKYDDQNQFVQIMAWSVEPLFADARTTFENVIRSYRRMPPATSAKPAAAPPKPK